jgi:hypothetical protein
MDGSVADFSGAVAWDTPARHVGCDAFTGRKS